ncbi:MAG: coenzyme F430 synthase [Candidatus Methanoperedens sp.]
MRIDSSSRVAVLDLTHGGLVLARKLKDIAGSVTAVDVYKTSGSDVLGNLEKDGIATFLEATDVSGFDILVAPVHLKPSHPMLIAAKVKGIPVITHHEAAGEVLSQLFGKVLEDKTVIEITGTKAKTSTAHLLAGILSKNRKVVSHTSRGVEDWNTGKVLKKGLSITPASILSAMDAVREAKLEPDVYIFEISLGGTGCADTGVITTISNDYRIANGTARASEAKRQMILNAKPRSKLVVNHDALKYFGACRRDVELVSFSDELVSSCNVYYEDISSNGAIIAYFIGKKHGKIRIIPSHDYDITSYKIAFVCATAVALSMGVDAGIIEKVILDFRGAEGRMRKTQLSGRTLIDNSNSGMDIRTAEKALSYSKQQVVGQGEKIIMVLGEEARQVCEGLDPAGVRRFVEKYSGELDALVLVGDRMKPVFRDYSGDKMYYADSLEAGIQLAEGLTDEKDIILSCVKCFR